MVDLQSLRERVQEAIDRRATAVEALHHSMAAQLHARMRSLLPLTGELEEIHRSGISVLYEAIRTLNQATADTLGILFEAIHRTLKRPE